MSVGFPSFRHVQAYGADVNIRSSANISSMQVFNGVNFTNETYGTVGQVLIGGGFVSNNGEITKAALVGGNLLNNNKVSEVGAMAGSNLVNFGEVEKLLAENSAIINKNLVGLTELSGESTFHNEQTATTVLAGDKTQIINSGEVVAISLLGETELLNDGMVGDLFVREKSKVANDAGHINSVYMRDETQLLNNGMVGDLFVREKSKVANDAGHINSVYMRDETQLLNNNTIETIDAYGNIDLGNDGYINSLKMEAHDDMLINFLNTGNGVVGTLDATVLSPNNKGFINIDNQGRLKKVDLYDYAGIGERFVRDETPPPPPPPPPPRDLIDLYNSGVIDDIHTDTYTFSEEFKRGHKVFERFSLALIRIFDRGGTIISADYNGNTELH